MRKYLIIFAIALVSGLHAQTTFSEEAMKDVFITEDASEISFSDIIEKHRGETVFIDIWASWCKDCIVGMPKVKQLQNKYKEVTFLFLSLDRTVERWKKSIEHLNLKGEHYFIQSGWEGGFCSTIDLDWIPRYMIVNPEGSITLYKAIEADDIRIQDALNNKMQK